MPLWQRILRLTAAGLIITGLAQPQWNTEAPLEGKGPVVLVDDNDWSAARNWSARIDQMKIVIERAESADRQIIVVPNGTVTGKGYCYRICTAERRGGTSFIAGIKTSALAS